MTLKLFTHNGVTTERAECAVSPASSLTTEHDAHKWRPGEKTEWFTCPGLVKCQYCVNLIWRDLMVQHVQDAHADQLEPSEPAPATHTGRPAQHSSQRFRLRDLTEQEKVDALDSDAYAVELAETPGFHAWWRTEVDEAAPTIERKAGEYGSNSLAEMGRMFARAQGRDRIEDHEALEIGCMIYAKGKLERVLDAMLKGRLPSTDTWHDLGVYSSMAQYIREHKRWP